MTGIVVAPVMVRLSPIAYRIHPALPAIGRSRPGSLWYFARFNLLPASGESLMCVLVGAVAQRNVVPLLMDGLKHLEHRGYDSAGLAYLDDDAAVGARRCVGKVRDLQQSLEVSPLSSRVGIAHTRWATHGQPEERNAHPQLSHGEVALVHNGIVENYEVLRKILLDDGYQFLSDTDTEVIVHLVHLYMKRGQPLIQAVRGAVQHLSGAYAIAVLSAAEPDCLVVAQHESPLVIGVGDDEQFVASDASALLSVTRRFIFLEDGDVAALTRKGVHVIDSAGRAATRSVEQLDLSADIVDKGDYPHYMLKEIFEQPQALIDTLEGRVSRGSLLIEGLGFRSAQLIDRIRALHIVGCGSSFHAAETARYWIESLARIPCSVDLASEYRYRLAAVPPDCLFVILSQSGETADTLAALRHAQGNGYLATLAVCNMPESSLAREADLCLATRAGSEIGVASTKAFTAQLLAQLMLAILLARRNWAHSNKEHVLIRQLIRVAPNVQAVLALSAQIETLAAQLLPHPHALVLARGSMYPIAREAALKLKEVGYVHAEAHAAGELKHGPLTLVDAAMPVIALAPTSQWLEKIKCTLHEVNARGGRLLVFTDADSGIEPGTDRAVIRLPRVDELVSPIVYAVAVQLLAYHLAVLRNNDVDQPRNLAKSVAVE